jgi:predicted nucleic acid-binding protein
MVSYYVDASVLLHAILGTDTRAHTWFRQASRAATLASSTLLRLETIRVLRRDGQDPALAEPFLQRIALISIDDRTLQLAATFADHIKTLDAIHLATLLLTDPSLTLVTHDRTMAHVAAGLGLATCDPLS